MSSLTISITEIDLSRPSPAGGDSEANLGRAAPAHGEKRPSLARERRKLGWLIGDQVLRRGAKIEPFVKQLLRLMDKLKAGETNNLTKLTRPGKDHSRAILFAAIVKTVSDGRTIAAYHTT